MIVASSASGRIISPEEKSMVALLEQAAQMSVLKQLSD